MKQILEVDIPDDKKLEILAILSGKKPRSKGAIRQERYMAKKKSPVIADAGNDVSDHGKNDSRSDTNTPPPPSLSPTPPIPPAPAPTHTPAPACEAPCTEEEAWRYANGSMLSITREGVSLWFAKCQSNGWTTVRANGAIIEQIRDWRANLRASIPWISEQLAKTKTAISRQKAAESQGKTKTASFFP